MRGRVGGKTAIVAPHDFTYGFARPYIAMADAYDLPFEHQAFRSLAEALEWPGVDSGDLTHGVAAE